MMYIYIYIIYILVYIQITALTPELICFAFCILLLHLILQIVPPCSDVETILYVDLTSPWGRSLSLHLQLPRLKAVNSCCQCIWIWIWILECICTLPMSRDVLCCTYPPTSRFSEAQEMSGWNFPGQRGFTLYNPIHPDLRQCRPFSHH